jgi:ribonuclease HI
VSKKSVRKELDKINQAFSENEIELLEEIIQKLKIKDWDYLLIGDGSGSNLDEPCAWASVMFSREDKKYTHWYGGMRHGTVNIAEFMAFVQPIQHLINLQKVSTVKKALTVQVVTDSDYVSKIGNSLQLGDIKNKIYWLLLAEANQQGVFINWNYHPRNDFHLSFWADFKSKYIRKKIKKMVEEMQNDESF